MAPYPKGHILPGERGNKAGHQEFIANPLIQDLKQKIHIHHYEIPNPVTWHDLPKPDVNAMPLDNIISSDGSNVIITSPDYPYARMGLVQFSTFRTNVPSLTRISHMDMSPYSYQSLIHDSTDTHQLFLPLNGFSFVETTVRDTIRELLYIFFNQPASGASMLETLHWLIYETYRDDGGMSYVDINCPSCGNKTPLSKDDDRCVCPRCDRSMWLTDWLSFQNIVQYNFAPPELIEDVMSICETLIIFGQINGIWVNNRHNLSNYLFLKDGPLFFRPLYQHLVYKIRKFLQYAKDSGNSIFLAGQEKTGDFVRHLQSVAQRTSSGTYLIPDAHYIANYIKFLELDVEYGRQTNYGVKILAKYDNGHSLVLNIPTGMTTQHPKAEDIIGLNTILATVHKLLSVKYENALFPIEQVNRACSISEYPSAKILTDFFVDRVNFTDF